jgi:hypothetical protein
MRYVQFLVSAVSVAAAAVVSSNALAQKTYRCGNTYQSFPCAGNDGKAVKSTDGGAATKQAGADPAAKPASASASAGKTAEAAKPQMTEEEKKAATAKAAEADAEKKKAAALADKKSKCDKLKNDLNYNTAQLRAGGSQVTQDRLNAERRQINDNLGRDGCSA